jgi:hypothetical protein
MAQLVWYCLLVGEGRRASEKQEIGKMKTAAEKSSKTPEIQALEIIRESMETDHLELGAFRALCDTVIGAIRAGKTPAEAAAEYLAG